MSAVNFPAPVGGDTDRDDDRLGYDPVIHPGLAVGGIEEHMLWAGTYGH